MFHISWIFSPITIHPPYKYNKSPSLYYQTDANKQQSWDIFIKGMAYWQFVFDSNQLIQSMVRTYIVITELITLMSRGNKKCVCKYVVSCRIKLMRQELILKQKITCPLIIHLNSVSWHFFDTGISAYYSLHIKE